MLSLATSRLAQRLMAFARASLSRASRTSSFAGQWVALDRCRYEEGSDAPSEGWVVDSDADLGELCSRLRSSSAHRCVIVHADEGYQRDFRTDEPLLRELSAVSPAA